MQRNFNTYLKLFTSSFYISMFIIGAGYIAIPLFKKKFVDELKWIDNDEMLDLIAIAQSAPGAVAVNSAISVGYKIGGIFGAISSIVGTILPPLIIISIIQGFYYAVIGNEYLTMLFKGMNAAVAAIMIDVVFKMVGDAVKINRLFSYCIMGCSFILVYFAKLNAAFVMIGSIILGILFGLQKKAVPKD